MQKEQEAGGGNTVGELINWLLHIARSVKRRISHVPPFKTDPVLKDPNQRESQMEPTRGTSYKVLRGKISASKS